MKVSRSDIEAVLKTYNSENCMLGEPDLSSTLVTELNNFINSTTNTLTGEGYEAVRTVMLPTYNTILDERSNCSKSIEDSIKQVYNSWKSFLDEPPELDPVDTSQRPSFQAELNSANDNITSLESQLNSMKSSDKGYSQVAASLETARQSAEKFRKILEKIDKLESKDGEINSKFQSEYEQATRKYENYVNNLMDSFIGFGAKPDPIDTSKLTGGTLGGIPSNPEEESDYDDGSYSGAVNLDDTTTTPSSAILAAAVSTIGYNADDLNNDENSYYFQKEEYYSDSEDWNSKYVNDILQRDNNTRNLLEDYYSDEESYPDPINNTNSLLKYAMKDDNNMDFNWSDASISKMEGANLTETASYSPQEGDIVFFNTSDQEKLFTGEVSLEDLQIAGRVGIVKSVETGVDDDGNDNIMINVIEGYATNTGSIDKVVTEKKYSINDERILGYGTISGSKTATKDTTTSLV